MQCVQGEQSGGMSTWRRRWAGWQKAATSYEQEAAVVEEDEEMEREDERGVAKRQASTS